MLQFIYGRAGAGKSTYIYEHILKNKAAHGNILLLVPEQYTFESEKALLHRFGDGFAAKAEVLSFTRMAENAGRLYGGLAGQRLTEAERFVLMNSVVRKNTPVLKVFGRAAGSSSFVKQLLAVLTELKTADISAEKLAGAATATGGLLQQKLQEIALLYAEYEARLCGVFIDPLDDPERFYQKALKHGYFKNKTVYLDAFKGFTGQQKKILHLILKDCKDCYISLCCNKPGTAGVGVFENIQILAGELTEWAAQYGVPVAEPVLLENRYATPEMQALEQVLAATETVKFNTPNSSVFLAPLKNEKEEVAFTFQRIRQLVREKGYRFDDFVVIARDISVYERYLSHYSKQDGVPCFFDRRKPLAVSPLVRLVLYALRSARQYESAAILSMLKTGFLPFSVEQIGTLEEYLYIWKISEKTWLEEWTMNPAGLKQEAELSEKTANRLAELNQMRNQIITVLKPLNAAFGHTAEKISTALYNLLTKLNANVAVQQAVKEAEAQNNPENADFLTASWDALMRVLDSLVLCMGEQPLTAAEYTEAFEACVFSMSVGNIPRMLDEVTAGSADRIRPSRPKVAFLLGLNQGVFPAPCQEGGLLLKNDRLKLEAAGLELSDRYRRFTLEENFLAYSAGTCATGRVYFCYHNRNSKGETTNPSPIIERLEAAFPALQKLSANAALPQTPAAARHAFLCGENYTAGQKSALKAWLNENQLLPLEDSLQGLYNNPTQRIQPAIAEYLFGNKPELSPTRLEKYFHCPFSYYCQFVLKASSPKPAEINNLQRGTVVHFVLENVLTAHKNDFKALSKEQLLAEIQTFMQQYFDQIPGEKQFHTKRFAFICRELSYTLLQILEHLQKELAQSEFVPERFEMEIGQNGEIPALNFVLPNGKTLSLIGKVDRLDSATLQSGQFVRIIDYKTGRKEFNLCDVLNGFNMQMLLYLYAVQKNWKPNENCEVAGILYFPALRSIEALNGKSEGFCMNGLLTNNKTVLAAMDPAHSGGFVPDPTGTTKKSKQNFIPQEEFETVFRYIHAKTVEAATQISSGNFDIAPAEECNGNACKYCDFAAVCRELGTLPHRETVSQANEEVLAKMKEALKEEPLHGI